MLNGMAFEYAIEQRYNLILKEIDRRKAYYEHMDALKFTRLLIWQFAIFFLLIMAFFVFVKSKSAKNNLRKNAKSALKNAGKDHE